MRGDGYRGLMGEDTSQRDGCEFCGEALFERGAVTPYGARIILKQGSEPEHWFATLSPVTGSHPEEDFTIQLMPVMHLTHLSQMDKDKKLAANYGLAFARISAAMTQIMMEERGIREVEEERGNGAALAAYGKCTTWREKKEHLHLKIYQFRGLLSQPAPPDSSLGKMPTWKDPETGEEFLRYRPVSKRPIDQERMEALAKRLLELVG